MKKKLIIIFFISSSIAFAQDQDSLMLKFNDLSNKLYGKPVNYLFGDQLLYKSKDYFTNTNLESQVKLCSVLLI